MKKLDPEALKVIQEVFEENTELSTDDLDVVTELLNLLHKCKPDDFKRYMEEGLVGGASEGAVAGGKLWLLMYLLNSTKV